MKPIVRKDMATAVTVADLIMEQTRVWDVDKLKENMSVMDVEDVLKIKLSSQPMEDLNAWAFERNGVYLVCSAYKLLKDIQMSEADHVEGGTTSSEGLGQWWRHLWKMKIPPKVRIFWWRAIHSFLPAKAVLLGHHIVKEGHCNDYGHSSESIFHTMFECSYAHRFWECIKELTGLKPPRLHPDTWAKDLLVGQSDKIGTQEPDWWIDLHYGEMV
ncbi:hypothetical protein HU200_003344 [Digitaria exilis]|uniref:Reverse transcriptase zinc-binding domain-containing protein n=1 Tax=Digitaria exilis TaxID=1010633 RepID=A0A835KUE9_9POAL|nr:hypothetical protein HU200_003344 [Digitaria exilis]